MNDLSNAERLAELQQREQELSHKLSDAASLSPQDIEDLSRELSHVSHERTLRERIAELTTQQQEWESLKRDDPSMSDDADNELRQIAEQRKTTQKELAQELSPDADGSDTVARRLIIEIRAGAGGDEAALFAAELFRMYQRYAEQHEWSLRVLSANRTPIGGLREIIAELTAKKENILSFLQYEAGVHRVQRIPETEKSGRIHTSTATVAILRVPEAKEISIRPEDIDVDTFRSSGPGGQNVNKIESAVRMTHTPSGIVVSSQEGRSQADNRENALEMLRARLKAHMEEQAAKERGEARRGQIGTGERSEKIRTYNIPQDRVTDHRIKKNFHNVPAILDGSLDTIIEALQEAEIQ